MTKGLQVRPEPLPETSDELVARRPDAMVDRVGRLMLDGAYPLMRPFLNSTCKEDSIEGKVIWDRASALAELREFAKQHGDELVANLTSEEADRCIGKIMRKYKFGRNQRVKQAMQQMMLPMSDEQTVTDNGDEQPVTDNG